MGLWLLTIEYIDVLDTIEDLYIFYSRTYVLGDRGQAEKQAAELFRSVLVCNPIGYSLEEYTHVPMSTGILFAPSEKREHQLV